MSQTIVNTYTHGTSIHTSWQSFPSWLQALDPFQGEKQEKPKSQFYPETTCVLLEVDAG